MAEEVVITRTFEAPRELVWRAWTDPVIMRQYWGPKGFTSPACEIDLRVGGKYLACMRSPDGMDYWSTGTYREIVPLERIVATDSFADPEGNIVPASYYGMSGDWPVEMLVTVTFEGQGNTTKLTLRHSGIEGFTEKDMQDMRQGWDETLDKLEGVLEELKRQRAAA